MGLRISGLLLRYVYLYRRSAARSMEIVFWPLMDLLVWGFLSRYLQRVSAPAAVQYLLGAMILWDVLYRSQQAISLAITEDIWTKNVLNVFVTPIRTHELLAATCLLGVIKAALPAVLLTVVARVFYDFDLLSVGAALVPFFASLLLFGWAVGMVTAGFILRYGQAAEALVWGVPFLIQPISAVFYPLDVLPTAFQWLARLLPSTYVFEGMRAVLQQGHVDGRLLATAVALNLAYLAGGAFFFGWMIERGREKGYLGRLGLD